MPARARKPQLRVEMFEWSSPAGQTVALPLKSLKAMKAGTLRRISHANDIEGMFLLIEEVCDAKTLAQIDDLDVGDMGAMFAEWMKTAGVSLPQS